MSRLEEVIAALCPDGVEHKTIRELCDVYTGGEVPEDYLKGVNPNGEYQYPIYSNGVNEKSLYGFSKKYRIKEDAVCFSSIGTIGFPTIRNGKFTPIIRLKVIVPKKESNLLLGFLKYSLEVANFERNKSSVPNINADLIKNIVIPFPPLPVQKEIVRILDQYSAAEQELEAQLDAELEAREKQYAYYRDALLDFSPDKPRIGSKHSRLNKLIETLCPDGVVYHELNEVINYEQPNKFIVQSTNYDDRFSIPVLTAGQTFILGYTSEDEGIYLASSEKPVIIFDDFTTSFHWVDFDFKVKSSALKILTVKNPLVTDFRYLFYAIKCVDYEPTSHSRQWIDKYSKIKIPIPPIQVQKEIVRILDQFDTLVNDIKQGLPAEISARRKQYEYYRDKLLTFKEKQA